MFHLSTMVILCGCMTGGVRLSDAYREFPRPYRHLTLDDEREVTAHGDKGPQTTANLTAMGQNLFDLLNGRNVRLYPATDLRTHALNTIAVESPRG
jgi:hypothetical protein